MFTDSLSKQQWAERLRFSSTKHIQGLRSAMQSPAYAAARRMGAGPSSMILELAEAELAYRAEVKAASLASERPTLTYIGPMSNF